MTIDDKDQDERENTAVLQLTRNNSEIIVHVQQTDEFLIWWILAIRGKALFTYDLFANIKLILYHGYRYDI